MRASVRVVTEDIVASSRRSRTIAAVLLGSMLLAPAPGARAASMEELEQKLKGLEEQMRTLKEQMEQTKSAPPPTAPAAQAPATPVPVAPGATSLSEALAAARPSVLSDFRLGGYLSSRFEASDLKNLNNTFTFRRFVLSGDATIAEKFRAYVELELERFTELEVERKTVSENGQQGFSQSIEGSNNSEVSLEQAWMQFELAKWLRFRMGNILVPVGRFNINHDDNLWNLPRRSLVDRGVPVLPSTAAWSEVGLGFNGDVATDRWGTFSYQIYVMNGVALDSSIETGARGSGELEAEVEIQPRRGTGNLDVKRDKAGAARIAWSPSIGQELGLSGYYGRYTPDFLPSEQLWAISVDGKVTLGPFELEGEYVRTHFSGISRVAQGFARSVVNKEFGTGTAPLEAKIDFELSGLADTKQGYWIEARYRFFPNFLRDTILGRSFDNPQFILVARGEQVWLDGLVRQIDFEDTMVTSISRENRFVNRMTLGLAYRPVPLIVFQAAFERTWTDSGKSLAAVTNFLPARTTENIANTFLFGAAFGF